MSLSVINASIYFQLRSIIIFLNLNFVFRVGMEDNDQNQPRSLEEPSSLESLEVVDVPPIRTMEERLRQLDEVDDKINILLENINGNFLIFNFELC